MRKNLTGERGTGRKLLEEMRGKGENRKWRSANRKRIGRALFISRS